LSIIKANTFQDRGGNTILSSDGSGTITASSSLASSVASVGGIDNTPYFMAYRNANQSLSDNTDTKIAFNAELWDPDGVYDASTNYRFQPTTAGKYLLFTQVSFDMGNANATSVYQLAFIKNGGTRYFEGSSVPNFYGNRFQSVASGIMDFNGSSDYAEVWGAVDVSGGTINVEGTSTNYRMYSYFYGCKLIGA